MPYKLDLPTHEVDFYHAGFQYVAHLELTKSHKEFIKARKNVQKVLIEADKRIYDRLTGRVSCVRPARILMFLICLTASFLATVVAAMLLLRCPRN